MRFRFLLRLRFTLLISLFFLLLHDSKATHFAGVELTYTCLNACTYRVSQKHYYDCGGAPIPPNLPGAPIVSFQGTPVGCTTVPVPVGPSVLVRYVDVSPICPGTPTKCTTINAVINGMREAVFYRDYNFCTPSLSPCTSFDITWGSCCRNGTITSGAAANNVFTRASTIDLSVSPCNSSPQFLLGPPIQICTGRQHHFSQRAYDPDGDSLSYRLVNCLASQSGTSVSYATGYSPQQPMGLNWLVNLNATSGELTFTPNPSGGPVTGVLCIEVEEWRGGVKIGSIVRDIMVSAVTNCGNGNSLPSVDSLTLLQGTVQQLAPTYFNMCQIDTLEILIHASDADSLQQVIMETTDMLPGLTFWNNSINPPTAVLRFIPPTFGEYDIPIRVLDDFCTVRGEHVEYIHVSVGGTCLTGTVTNTACGQSNGAIDLMISAGLTPFTYLWSNGATTEDISGLASGSYSVTATDAQGNTFTKSFFVNGTSINANASVIQPTCLNRVGSIALAPAGGMAPYTYSWNSGQSTASIGNLSPMNYTVTLTDASGCTRQENYLISPPDSCFNMITGMVFTDLNGNCVKDTNEDVIPYVIVDLSPGGATATDSNGYYSFRVDTGSFDVDLFPIRFKSVLCPAGGSHQTSFSTYKHLDSLDFAMKTDTVVDLEVEAYHSPVKALRSSYHYFRVYNNSNLPRSGTVTWKYAPIFQVQNFYPSSANYNGITREISWNFNNLLPGRWLTFAAQVTLGSGVMLGDTFTNMVQVLPIIGDSIPANNTQIMHDSVRGPFDPNDKQVSPQGIGPLGYIEQGEQEMSYTVRFQNTGNDTAFHVQIRDTIDINVLNALSFQRQIESHPYRLNIEDDSILVFDFDNIQLPDSTTDYDNSQGFVKFGMRHKRTLAPGAQIRNRAAIYFDTNAPIITNTVLNTIFAYPVVSLGPDSICAGDSLQATLGQTGVPPFAFLWSDGTSVLNNQNGISQIGINHAGTYQVRVHDAIGNEVLDSLAVTIAPEPNAAFVGRRIGVTDYVFTDTSGVNSVWFWDFGDGGTATGGPSEIYTYWGPGIYTATLITQNSCGSDTFSNTVDMRVSIEDDFFTQSINLFPHPVQDISYLQFDNPTRKLYSLRILDLQGRVVQSFPPQRGDQFEIARGDLASGVYLYELKGEKCFYGKMVVR